MARANQFIKRYKNFYGFDLKSSDLAYPEQYAQTSINIDINPVGSLVKRKGTSPCDQGAGALGQFVFNRIDAQGLEVQERLSVSDRLRRAKKTTLTVTYSGSATTATISVFYDVPTAVYRCQVTEGVNTLLNQSLGLGIDEALPYTVTSLAAAINALPGFLAAVGGTGSVPAAFLQTTLSEELVGAPHVITAFTWENVPTAPGVATPFSGGFAQVNSVDFEPASAAQLLNTMYFATGYDEIQKYDGQRVYRAGVPAPSAVTTALSAGAGSIPNGGPYVHRVRLVQVDASGNVTEGNLTDSPSLTVTGGPKNIDVSYTIAASGFNTACAIVNGAQTSVTTITVDNGAGGQHTMLAGDTAYFFDAVTADYVERQITGVTATSITIAGAAVTVADNAVISANLRVAIHRNRSTGTAPTIWYEVEQIPYNAFGGATQTYVDSKLDSAILIELIEPLTDRSPPPKCRYLTGFQNLLICGSLMGQPNVVAWSDVENPEYFPTPDNQQIIQNLEGDRITAVSPSNDVLVVFQKGAIHALSGDLPELNFRVDQITNDVGCIAHQSVRDIRGAIFFLSAIGPRLMTGASIPQALGKFESNTLVSRIDPLFLPNQTDDPTATFRLTRAWALHDRANQRYLLFLPKESVQAGVRYCNSQSTMLVYDYARDAWLEWQGINAGAGMVAYENGVIFTERALGTPLALRTVSYRRQATDQKYDYQDHNQPIAVFYRSPWDFAGEASLLKNYLILRVFTTDLVPNQFVLQCSTELNFRRVPISQFTLQVGSDGYGVAPYGQSYGDPQETSIKHKISNGRAKSLCMVFENSEPQTDIVITGYELEMVTPYKPAMKA
jgi:hypothetical protein